MSSSHWKRPREAVTPMPNEWDVQKVISGLNQAVTSSQRIRVLRVLLNQLGRSTETPTSKSQQDIAEYLVEAGAAHALCLQLGFVLNKQDGSAKDVELICRALDALFRYADAMREAAVHDIGTDLTTLLLKAVTEWDHVVCEEVMSIWQTIASNTEGTHMLLRCKGSLAAVVKTLRNDNESIRIHSLGILKHLTYYAEDHRIRIIEQAGLLHGLTRLSFSALNGKEMERISAVFRNFALAPGARSIMSQNNDILNALIRLCSGQANRRTTRNIMCTFNSLALETIACQRILVHGDGIVLNMLVRVLSTDDDAVVRRRAARVVHLLACAHENSTTLVLNHTDDIMERLFSCALNDSNNEVRLEASEAFACCAALIRSPMPQHTAVLKSLTHLASETAIIPEIIAKALKEQALYPCNRTAMVDHMGLLPALANIALKGNISAAAREYATRALHDLSSEESNREKMATPLVLEALVKNSSDRNGNSISMRGEAVNALLNLASADSNRKKLVTHEGLLQALVQYAALMPDMSTKGDVKRVIMMLVPLL